MLRLLFFLLLCIPFHCQAQSLTLKSQTTTKTFSSDTYFDFIFGDRDSECCSTNITGTINRIFADSIQVRINDISLDNKDLEFMMTLKGNIYDQNFMYTLPKSELLFLRGYKSKKNRKWTKNLETISSILILSGIVTLANSYLSLIHI